MRCRCSCGSTLSVNYQNLRRGLSTRCLRCAGAQRQRHGMSHSGKGGVQSSVEYSAWSHMRQRCLNPDDPRWSAYGGRGIKICVGWQGAEGFKNFLACIGPKPSPKHSLDRIDNDRGYEPGNVRWATAKEQQRNRRTNCRVTIDGVCRTQAEWLQLSGVSSPTAMARMQRGWPRARAITEPPRPIRRSRDG